MWMYVWEWDGERDSERETSAVTKSRFSRPYFVFAPTGGGDVDKLSRGKFLGGTVKKPEYFFPSSKRISLRPERVRLYYYYSIITQSPYT